MEWSDSDEPFFDVLPLSLLSEYFKATLVCFLIAPALRLISCAALPFKADKNTFLVDFDAHFIWLLLLITMLDFISFFVSISCFLYSA